MEKDQILRELWYCVFVRVLVINVQLKAVVDREGGKEWINQRTCVMCENRTGGLFDKEALDGTLEDDMTERDARFPRSDEWGHIYQEI